MIKKIVTVLLSLVLLGCSSETAVATNTRDYILSAINKEMTHEVTESEISKAEDVVDYIESITDSNSFGLTVQLNYDKENDLLVMQIECPDEWMSDMKDSTSLSQMAEATDGLGEAVKGILEDSDLETHVAVLVMTGIDEDTVLYANVDGQKYYQAEN